MDLTVIIQETKKAIDIKVNRQQVIEDTVSILEDGGILDFELSEGVYAVRSERKHERINKKLTYVQADIYTGDILYLES